MNRRAFTATLASVLGLKLPASAAPAVQVAPRYFTPKNCDGAFRWVQVSTAEAVKNAWTGRYRAVYQGLSEKYEGQTP